MSFVWLSAAEDHEQGCHGADDERKSCEHRFSLKLLRFVHPVVRPEPLIYVHGYD
jgi:hypothetical protein